MKPTSTTRQAFTKLLKTSAWKEAKIPYIQWKSYRRYIKDKDGKKLSLNKMEQVLTQCKVKKIQETLWEI